jgi:endonuclease-3
LSQNTNDANSGEAYRRLTEHYPTWTAAMEADSRELADVIRVGGLANQKAVRIQALLRWIQERYGRLNLDVLCEMEPEEAIRTFCALKGVGIKTISVVLAFACGRDVFPVDTHIHRISRRLGLAPEHATPERVHEIMQPLVPPGKAYAFHINLLIFGRTICHARRPACERCPLVEDCVWVRAHRPEVLEE